MRNEAGFAGQTLSTPKRRRYGFSAERHEERVKLAQERQEREHYEYTRSAPVGEGYCYFIGCHDGLVKIGFSRNVGLRLSQLRATSGLLRLHLFAQCRGGRAVERHYHRKFREHVVGEEWFNLVPEIKAEIALLNAGAA
jgi:hypothetical protein